MPALISKHLADNRKKSSSETFKHKKISFDDTVKETYDKPYKLKEKPSPGPMPIKRLTTFSDYYKSNPILFSVSFLIVSIILAIILWGFFATMTMY